MILNADNDSFYTMNDPVLVFLGTMIMWFSLAHLMAGF